jgi:hypothetical protein
VGCDVDEDERWQRAADNANENRQRSAARRRQRAEENAAVIRDYDGDRTRDHKTKRARVIS